MQTNLGFNGVLTWKIKTLSKNLSKTPMSSLTWLAQERKSNTKLISNLLTLKSQKELQRPVPKKESTDLFISPLPELMKIHNHSIFKPRPSESKSLKKPSQMPQFSDLVQFTVLTIISLQISKDKPISCGTNSSLFMMTAQPRNNPSEMVMSPNVFWTRWKWKKQR